MAQQSFSGKCYYLIYLFLAGLFLGIVIVNIGHDTWITENGILNPDMLKQVGGSMPKESVLLSYVIRNRMLTVCMIVVFSITVAGIVVICGYTCYLGITTGCLISVAVIRYGIWGILLIVTSMIPQGLFLIPGYLMLFCWGIDCSRMVHQYGFYHGTNVSSGIQLFLRKGGQLFLILLVVIIGCMIESYVNPKCLKFIINLLP